MKLAISLLNFRPGKIGGTETYLRQLIAALPAVRGDDEVVLVTYRDNADALADHGLTQVVAPRNSRQVVTARCLEAFTAYRARWAERLFQRIAPDAILFPQQSIFPKRVSYPAALTVHDLQHLFYPEYFSAFDRAFRRFVYPASLRRADRIIAISNFTRKTLLDRYSICPDKVMTIGHGFAPTYGGKVDDGCVPAGEYLYYPAATLPHKHHAVLFDSIAKLHSQGQFDYRLILSGKQTAYWKKLQQRIRRLQLEDVVLHVGFVSYQQVCSLYRGAEAVLFPTQFEGFGLPITEAVSFEKKVIASDLEVFREIGVPQSSRIDFTDAKQLHRALQMPGPTLLEKRPLTWEECAQATTDVLRECAVHAS